MDVEADGLDALPCGTSSGGSSSSSGSSSSGSSSSVVPALRIVTWNIGLKALRNTLAAVSGGRLAPLLSSLRADILCLQETKAGGVEDLSEESALAPGYHSFFSFTRKREGYAGVATIVRDGIPVLAVHEGITGALAAPLQVPQSSGGPSNACAPAPTVASLSSLSATADIICVDSDEVDDACGGAGGSEPVGAAGLRATALRASGNSAGLRAGAMPACAGVSATAPAAPFLHRSASAPATVAAAAATGPPPPAASPAATAAPSAAAPPPSDYTVSPLELDSEGRCIITDHGAFVLINTYVPALSRAARDETRYAFKGAFHDAITAKVRCLQAAGRRVVVVGDLNVCHREIDHCDPAEWVKERKADFGSSPFRIWMTALLAPLRSCGCAGGTTAPHSDQCVARLSGGGGGSSSGMSGPVSSSATLGGRQVSSSTDSSSNCGNDSSGTSGRAHRVEVPASSPRCAEVTATGGLVDAYRAFHPTTAGAFTCWSIVTGARTNNYGTRLDYTLVDAAMVSPQTARTDTHLLPRDGGVAAAAGSPAAVASGSARSSCGGSSGSTPSVASGGSGCLTQVDCTMVDAGIMPEQGGSDHCPAYVTLTAPVEWGTSDGDTAAGSIARPSVAPAAYAVSVNALPAFTKRQASLKAFMRTGVAAVQAVDPTPASGSDVAASAVAATAAAGASSAAPGARKASNNKGGGQANLFTYGVTRRVVATTTTATAAVAEAAAVVIEVLEDDDDVSDTAATVAASAAAAARTTATTTAWGHLLGSRLPPPTCRCGVPSVERTVLKKEGGNFGRVFFVCNRPAGKAGDANSRCDFFQWLDAWRDEHKRKTAAATASGGGGGCRGATVGSSSSSSSSSSSAAGGGSSSRNGGTVAGGGSIGSAGSSAAAHAAGGGAVPPSTIAARSSSSNHGSTVSGGDGGSASSMLPLKRVVPTGGFTEQSGPSRPAPGT
jgi:exonuclease III